MNVAIVGCGRMGRERARAVVRLGGRVSAVCDGDAERAEELAGEVGAPVIERSVEHLPWGGLDAVFVCTPPASRGWVEELAVAEGTSVFLEKPVGTSLRACASLARAVARTGVVAAVGYMNRHRPGMAELRERLTGEEVLGVSAVWMAGRYGVPWWSDPAQSGGPINEQATHMVDLCRYLLGEVTEVCAAGLPGSAAHDADTAAVLLRFARGTLGTLLYSCRSREKQIDLLVYTTSERIHLRGWDFWPASDADGARPMPNEVFTHEVQEFLRAVAVRDPTAVRCTLPDALRTQRVVDGVLRSLRRRAAPPRVHPPPAPGRRRGLSRPRRSRLPGRCGLPAPVQGLP